MQSRRSKTILAWTVAGVVILGAGGAVAEYRHEQSKLEARAEAITGGSVGRGQRAFLSYGCGGCHSIPGVPKASGMVGPPLSGIAGRAVVAGRLENKPENLELWIMHPQEISPGTAMPDLGVKPQDARDIAAFLYTQS